MFSGIPVTTQEGSINQQQPAKMKDLTLTLRHQIPPPQSDNYTKWRKMACQKLTLLKPNEILSISYLCKKNEKEVKLSSTICLPSMIIIQCRPRQILYTIKSPATTQKRSVEDQLKAKVEKASL